MALIAGGMPLHHQLYLVLREQIGDGALRPGAALPTEQALCDVYDVSRITVRRALQDLSDHGYVVRRQGRGTFVAEPARRPKRRTMRESLTAAQLETTAEVVELDQRRPPSRVRRALELGDEDEVAYVRRVRRRGRVPVMITDAWLPLRFAELLTKESLERSALYEILERSGVTIGRISQEFTAEVAEPVRARLLDVDIGSALIRINRLEHDTLGAPTLYLSIYATPERSRVLTEIAAPDIDTTPTGVLIHDVEPADSQARSVPRRPFAR